MSGNYVAPPGYGPRDAERDFVAPSEARQGRVRARVEIVITGLVVGLFGTSNLALAALALSSGLPLESIPALIEILVVGALGLYGLACTTWFLFVPLLTWDEDGLVLRHRPWRAPLAWAARDVAWRPRTPYVGRYLLLHEGGRRPQRFPLWLLRRSAARRLFAYLDEACEATRPGRRVGPSRS